VKSFVNFTGNLLLSDSLVDKERNQNTELRHCCHNEKCRVKHYLDVTHCRLDRSHKAEVYCIQVFREMFDDPADWCDVEIQIDWGIHYFVKHHVVEITFRVF